MNQAQKRAEGLAILARSYAQGVLDEIKEREALAADKAYDRAKADGTLQREADRRALDRELNHG